MTTIRVQGKPLYQWDTDRRVIIEPGNGVTIDDVHFSVDGENSLGVEHAADENGIVSAPIPNILLQSGSNITVYACMATANGQHTIASRIVSVINRAKPADYVYTETEVKSYAALKKKLSEKLPANQGAENAGKALVIDDDGNVVPREVQGGGGGGALVEPDEDDIPKVFFGGALQQTKDEAVVSFRYISKTQDVSGYAEIKAQGNSSMSYPKKNQTVKLYKDAACEEKLKIDFKGWGKQSKFCFKANWIDLTHARNVVSARLWADVVKSRSNYEELPELLRTSPNQGAVDGFPIKVYADGVYQGRYTVNIPKDAWMANMDDELDTHCILCGENYVSGCFRASANINGSDWTDEIHKTVPASIKTRWNEVISFVMNSTDEDFKANIGNYFYVDSLIDYYLFGLVSCGLDAFGKNQLYMTYDGQKWIATMYDMDSTWGLYWNGSRFVATNYARTSYEDFVNTTGNLLYVRLEQLFYEELQTRWAELKNGVLSVENIINRFERFTDIAPVELVKEDYAPTTGGGSFSAIPSQSTNNIQQIRAFALERLAWTDEYVAALTGGEDEPDEPVVPDEPDVPSSVPCTGISLDKTAIKLEGNGSQTLTANVTPSDTTDLVTWESGDDSVATVEGGVVTAISNGTTYVAAICGNFSATCSVEISGLSVTFETASWKEGYYNDTGVFKQELNMHHTECIPLAEDFADYGYLVSCVDGSGINLNGGYVRICYFDADMQYLGFNRGTSFKSISAGNETYIEILTVANAAYYVVCANTEDKSKLTMSRYQRHHVAATMENSNWLRTGYGDNGETNIGNVPSDYCRSSYFEIGDTQRKVTVAKDTGEDYLRISYFDESFNHLGWDVGGSGLNINNATLDRNEITVRLDVANAKYFVISANTRDKSLVTIS